MVRGVMCVGVCCFVAYLSKETTWSQDFLLWIAVEKGPVKKKHKLCSWRAEVYLQAQQSTQLQEV